MKDFSSLGQTLSRLQERELNHHLRKALSVAASISSLGSSLPSRYASLYAGVQMVKYSDDGTPQDITDAARQSIPNYQCQLELNEAKRLQKLRNALTDAVLANGNLSHLFVSRSAISIDGYDVAELSFTVSDQGKTTDLDQKASTVLPVEQFTRAFNNLSDSISLSGDAVRAKVARCVIPEFKNEAVTPYVFIVYMVPDGAVSAPVAGVFVIHPHSNHYYCYVTSMLSWEKVSFKNNLNLYKATIPTELINEFVRKLIGGDWSYSRKGPTYCADVHNVLAEGKETFSVIDLVPDPEPYIKKLESLI